MSMTIPVTSIVRNSIVYSNTSPFRPPQVPAPIAAPEGYTDNILFVRLFAVNIASLTVPVVYSARIITDLMSFDLRISREADGTWTTSQQRYAFYETTMATNASTVYLKLIRPPLPDSNCSKFNDIYIICSSIVPNPFADIDRSSTPIVVALNPSDPSSLISPNDPLINSFQQMELSALREPIAPVSNPVDNGVVVASNGLLSMHNKWIKGEPPTDDTLDPTAFYYTTE
jgi:hypothetical protein